ncbi:anti-sigma factor [Actinoplanes rectilineatus]|nr:zf-HC2 domain-containing protein [Actinoplanes rectilineatus]GLY05846.1 anti-sigma factor [Actinoplanes sp. NBRC 101535]
MRCEDGHDDAAYVLGALSPAERAAYERHLATCSFCREAVADLSRVPDMLDRLEADEFARWLDPDHAVEPERPRKPQGRVKTFSVRLLSTAASIVLILVLGGGVFAWWWMGQQAPAEPVFGPAVAMSSIESTSPIAATIQLAGSESGTKVRMQCEYSVTAEPYNFKLIAYGPDGEKEQLGSWLARPGAEFSMDGGTRFTQGALARFELVRLDNTKMLVLDVK